MLVWHRRSYIKLLKVLFNTNINNRVTSVATNDGDDGSYVVCCVV